MEWTQVGDDVWVLNGPESAGQGERGTLGTVRYRDGAWWGEIEPSTAGTGSLDEPAGMSEESFKEAMANLPDPLGPFDTPDDAKKALEQAVQGA